MGWKIYGRRFESGQLSNTDKFQSVTFNRNMILKSIRTWIIVNNDPIFTDLSMKIYSNEVISGDNTPKKLLHTSANTLQKADIITAENGAREIWFEFDASVQENTVYNFVLGGSGYVYSLASHLAWRVSWPDPVYSGYTPTEYNASIAPYPITAVGSDF